jgi:glutamyl-tRNA reductase
VGYLVMVGASHKSASLAELERLAVRDHNRELILSSLQAAGCSEVVALSTCSRTEIYAIAHDASGIVEALARVTGLDTDHVRRITVTREGDDAVAHLFRVAAGLDSRILGEVDIQDQVRAARVQADSLGMVGAQLQRLFVSAIGVARRIHQETGLGRRGRSVGRQAVEVAMATVEVEDAKVAIVGSGRMATVVTERLLEEGVRPASYARSRDRAMHLVGDEARAHPLEALQQALQSVDLVFCATSASEHLISREDLRRAMVARGGRPLTVVDLSVPRNVEGSASSMPGVRLIDLEGIEENAEHLEILQAVVVLGEAIVAAETARFVATQRARGAAPVIVALRDRVERVCLEELQRATRGSQTISPEELERAANAIAGKLLHRPIMAAREAAATNDTATLIHLCRLFRVDPPTKSATHRDRSDVAPEPPHQRQTLTVEHC